MPDFRIVDKRHPKPEPARRTLPPLPDACYMHIKNPNVHDSRRCYHTVGHEGMHHWEYCAAEWDCDGVAVTECELPIGHDGQHHATIDWD